LVGQQQSHHAMVVLQAVSRAESNQPVRLERIHDRIGKAGPSGPPGGQGQRFRTR
jgi:hypothetical protein